MSINLVDSTIEEFLEETGFGSRDRAMANLLYGINHQNIESPIGTSKATFGWTFFTRPQLNLRTLNLRRVRSMYPLLTKEELSIQRFVRTMLDPRLQYDLRMGSEVSKYYSNNKLRSPLVDRNQAFIPLLTNSIKSISGWPDEAVPTWTSPNGMRREQLAMVDGTYETNEVLDLSVTFKNYPGDPLPLLFQTWMRYTSLVFEGMMVPYLDFMLEDEIDYQTRIYRLTTDSTWTYLNHIAATGASVPINNPLGKVFDYNKGKPYSEQNAEININFKSNGVIYNDDILIKEFNETTAIFNPEFRRYLAGDTLAMAPIPDELASILNYRGYPYIDPKTYKIQWLIPTEGDIYRKLTKKFGIAKDSVIDQIAKGIMR